MKSNQIMVRDDSRFLQRTKDGYFNATSLLDGWNDKQPYKKRLSLGNYQKNKSTKNFIEQLKKEGLDKPMKATRGRNGGTWMHPKLYIDFAMWVSVEFKSIVIDYVLDGLIKSRHEAGDYYNQMSAAILETFVDYYKRKPPPLIFKEEARMIRELAGSSKDRNMLSEKELNIITSLQKMNTVLIKMRTGKASRIKQLTIYSQGLRL